MSCSKCLDEEFQIAIRGSKRRREQALSLIRLLESREGASSKPTLVPYAPLEPGEVLKLSGQPDDSVFIVSRGILKHASEFVLGAPHVCGFYGEGSVIDVSLQPGAHSAESFIAVERTWVYRIGAHLLPMDVNTD